MQYFAKANTEYVPAMSLTMTKKSKIYPLFEFDGKKFSQEYCGGCFDMLDLIRRLD